MDPQLDMIKQLHGASPVPYAVADGDFRIVWANGCALRRYPQLSVPGGLSQLLTSRQLEEASRRTGAFTIALAGIDRFAASFTPIEGGFLVSFGFADPELAPAMLPESTRYIISALSSRLRHPLGNIFAGLSSLAQREEIRSDQRLAELVESINSNGYSILRFATDFTSYLRYIIGEEPFSPRNIDLADFLRNFVLAAGIVTDSVTISADIPDGSVIVCADQASLNHALLHIISNCCRFGGRGGSIRITLEPDGANARITVSDSGPGIPTELLPRICEPFFSHDPLGEPMAGCGLGLTIARQAVIRNNGSFVITSAPGEGTSVAIGLPLVKESPAALESPLPAADMLRNRFSLLHVVLSDSCGNPKA